jgi:hypothetical protein
MSQQDDVLDGQIRAALLGVYVRDADPARALLRVRTTARARRIRHRILGVLGSTLVLGLVVVTLTRSPGQQAVVTDSPPASTTSSVATTDYGFEPLAPLVDGPLPMVPATVVAERNGHVLTVGSAPDALTLTLHGPGGSGGLSGDPQTVPALVSAIVGPAPEDPAPRDYIIGATRAEVARVDWVRESGTARVETIEHAAFPQLRFFIIEAAAGSIVSNPDVEPPILGEAPVLVAYAADGTVLTDSERIQSEEEAFTREADRR